MNLEDIIKETKTYYCLECGKCTSLCPVSRHNSNFSPRLMLERALMGFGDELIHDRELFSCLSCYACSNLCPSDVDYPVFTQKVRNLASGEGEHGDCAHSGTLLSIMRLTSRSDIKQKRLDWLDGLHTSEKSEVLYFAGCAPYFEPVFEDIEVSPVNIARNSIKVLNALGIEPMVLPNERCCGHDLLWTGDVETFKKLAQFNAQMIKESGAKKIVFSCPEGYRTFKLDYPNYVDLGCDVQHVSELLAEKIGQNGVKFKEIKKKVTYQDPCRLGRHLGIYEPPREIIKAIPGIELVEMEHSGDESICCGTSVWTNCSSYSKQIREERLLEARATGADMLITACPKCQIHFKCAMVDKGAEKGPDIKMEVMDLVNLVANAMET
ncbi:MAG: (Fe-S)-binding protein [Dehalococcoidia bacterium]|nr:(Fe-S)-binding protein [Dehalococcoidia bacterium]MDH4291562.1 (Fe-S)-binding protein [Dehalococcoidia bacterium]